MAEVIREAVLIGTAGVRKCRLSMSAPHGLVKQLVHFRDRAPKVQGAMGLPRMCTDPTAEVSREAVLIRTVGVQKCRLCMSAPHTLVKWLVHFRNHAPKVQGAMRLPRMSTERMAEVTRPPLVTCIYSYSSVRKCRLRMSAPRAFMKSLVHFWNRTHNVQGTMGLLRMCTEPIALYVYRVYSRENSGSCTDPYRGCTKMPFSYECSAYVGEVACAFSVSYT